MREGPSGRLTETYLRSNPSSDLGTALRRDQRGPTEERPSVREALSLEAKQRIADIVVQDALSRLEHPVLMWTGGKDSMLVLSYLRDAAEESDFGVPPLLFIDHGMHFPETWDLMESVTHEWGLQAIVEKNTDVLSQAGKPGEPIRVRRLSPSNQEEVQRAGPGTKTFPYALTTVVGNHLLKTVPMHAAIRAHGFDGVLTGIRWDESPARSRERFLSPRDDPPHLRVHPILPLSEREVWTETLRRGLPLHPLYAKGFRSIDGVYDSHKVADIPAWEQDLEGTPERAGRAQDKELLMQRLRDLGYM